MGISRDCYEKYHTNNRLYNLNKVDRSLDIHSLASMNHRKTNKTIAIRKCAYTNKESVIKNLSPNQRPEPEDTVSEFYRTLEEELSTFLKLFPKSYRGEGVQLLYKVTITARVLQGKEKPVSLVSTEAGVLSHTLATKANSLSTLSTIYTVNMYYFNMLKSVNAGHNLNTKKN